MPEIRRPSEKPLEERVADAFRRFFPADWEDRFRAWVELRRRPFALPQRPHAGTAPSRVVRP